MLIEVFLANDIMIKDFAKVQRTDTHYLGNGTLCIRPQFPPDPQNLYHSFVPLKPGLDAAGEAVLGVNLIVSHVEQNLQQLLLVLRLRHGCCFVPAFLLSLPPSLKQSVPGLLVWA